VLGLGCGIISQEDDSDDGNPQPDQTEKEISSQNVPISRRLFTGLTASTLAASSLTALGSGNPGQSEGRDTSTYQVSGLEQPAEILVDQWGVPHMYADSTEDVSFVQGFNAARDRLWQIDLWRRRALGELSEALGNEWIDHDRAAQLFTYRDDIESEWDAYGPGAEAIATGFAKGVNAFIDQIENDPEMLPVEFDALGYEPKHWDPEDIVRMRIHSINVNLSSEVQRAVTLREHGEDVEQVRRWLQPEEWEVEIPEGLDLDLIPEDVLDTFSLATMAHTSISFEEDDIQNPEVLDDLSGVTSSGGSETTSNDTNPDLHDVDLPSASNNWAIAPELTETGRPILANDRLYRPEGSVCL
jgi:penicillin G amidase